MWRDGIEAREYFLGLDLGQRRDHSAVVVLERRRTVFGPPSPVTFQRQRMTRLGIRYVERIPLDTPYVDVVQHVGHLVRSGDLAKNCWLAVDATGLGAPVVEMLRRSHYTCPIDAVVLTGGQTASQSKGVWHIPKHELMTGLQLLLEKKKLQVGREVDGADVLLRELEAVRVTVDGPGQEKIEASGKDHDDLVIALALACWAGRSPDL